MIPGEPTTANNADADADADAPDNTVRLSLPADPRYARVARSAVAAVAVRSGLDPAVVEDLRIAVDESLILLFRDALAPAAGDDVVIDIRGGGADLRVGLRREPPLGADGLDPAARPRFDELVPSRIRVDAVDAEHGVVRLGLRTS